MSVPKSCRLGSPKRTNPLGVGLRCKAKNGENPDTPQLPFIIIDFFLKSSFLSSSIPWLPLSLCSTLPSNIVTLQSANLLKNSSFCSFLYGGVRGDPMLKLLWRLRTFSMLKLLWRLRTSIWYRFEFTSVVAPDFFLFFGLLWNLNYTKSNKKKTLYIDQKKKNANKYRILQFPSKSFLILK